MAKKVNEPTELKRYNEFKQKNPDTILLIRVGDLYETFSADAKRYQRFWIYLYIAILKVSSRELIGSAFLMTGLMFTYPNLYVPASESQSVRR